MKKIFVLKFTFSLFTSMALLLCSNQLIKSYQIQQHNQIAINFLHYSEDVSGNLAEALKEAVRNGINGCSTDSIEKLRGIRQKYKYIDDIGLVRNNRIVCTAGWGILSDDLYLPASFYLTPNGYLLYRFNEGARYVRPRQSATVLDDFIIFNSALSFIDIMGILPDYHISLTTHNRPKLLHSYGEIQDKKSHVIDFLFSVKTNVCSKIRDLCVITDTSSGGLMTIPWLLILIAFAGLLPGFLLTSAISNLINSRKSLENRFIHALNNDELYMVYQPIVQVLDKRVVAFEALIRWQDRYFGAVSPELFINLAERLGAYHKLSVFVMKRTLAEMHDYLKAHPSLQLSINIGDEEIRDMKYIINLKDECRSRNINHGQIKLEITERCQSDYETISKFCQSVRQCGFSVSLDDFGTGSCNISWLTALDFDEVKIDKFLVQNIVDPDKRKMLLSIVDAMINTGARLVFEGVETSSQFTFLRLLNQNFLVQGWYTGKPVLLTDVNGIMNAWSGE